MKYPTSLSFCPSSHFAVVGFPERAEQGLLFMLEWDRKRRN